MKLPAAEYDRGLSSMGRDTSDPTAESRIKFGTQSAIAASVASISGQRTADLYYAVGAREKMADLQQQGYQAKFRAMEATQAALNQSQEVLLAWANAEETVRVSEAATKYKNRLDETTFKLKTMPTVPREMVPDGVLASDDAREQIPTWEVSREVFDSVEKEAYADSAGMPRSRKGKAALEAQLTTTRISNAHVIRDFYMTNKKKDLEGRVDETIRDNITNGRPADAKALAQKAFEAGIYDYPTLIKKREKIDHDVEDLATAKAIATTSDPFELILIADNTLQGPSHLSPDERRGYANTAIAKAQQLSKAEDMREEKARREASKNVLADIAERIRLDNYIPSRQELAEARKKMIPSDYLALIALIDRKDGAAAGGTTDPEEAYKIQLNIISMANPLPPGQTAQDRYNLVYDHINIAFANRKLSIPDREKFLLQLERYRNRPEKSLNYNMAEELIDANISPPKSFINIDLNDARRYQAMATEFKLDLADATRADPKIDPLEWVRRNMTRYRLRVDNEQYKQLHSIGLGSFVVSLPNGETDRDATKAALEKAGRDNVIPLDLMKRGIDRLVPRGTVQPNRNRDAK